MAGMPVAKGNKNWGEPGQTLPMEHYSVFSIPWECQVKFSWPRDGDVVPVFLRVHSRVLSKLQWVTKIHKTCTTL